MIKRLAAPPLTRTDFPAVALAATLPLLLLNPVHVPVLISGGGVDLRPSDAAILVVVAVALTSSPDTSSRTAARRWMWLLPFLVLLLISAAVVPDSGRVTVSVLKLAEYAAYGVAATLLLRRRRDLCIVTASLVCCAAAFGLVGAAQLLRDHQLGIRVESLTGADPLGLLGAAVLLIALAGPRFFVSRTERRAAAVAGVLCIVVSGSISAALAIIFGLVFTATQRLGPFQRVRRATLAALAVAALLVGGALVAVRWSDLTGAADQITATSYVNPRPGGSLIQRAMFADFGARIWLDHPITGVGYEQTPELREWTPYFASVRADFPGLDVTYFPPIGTVSFGRPFSYIVFGLHNVYSQLLAETGVVGFALFAVGFTGLVAATFRRAHLSEVACVGSVLALEVLAGFTNNELYGGLPAMIIFVIGLALAARGSLPKPVT